MATLVAPPPTLRERLAAHFRTCTTTGLPICPSAVFFIKLNAVAAVVFLLVGAIAAILPALTRWSAVHLLDPVWYYRLLTLHGINMLIFWILFFEAAILYFAGTSLLNTRLFSRKLARSEEHTSELQSRENLVCRLLLEKKRVTRRPGARATVQHSPTT